ncbi:E3 SUMO-protein ligase RanBP2 [Halotydeus destructor]|nr:E3 SUMO-protein ligase RanBP2 [Halotydeus destructor]
MTDEVQRPGELNNVTSQAEVNDLQASISRLLIEKESTKELVTVVSESNVTSDGQVPDLVVISKETSGQKLATEPAGAFFNPVPFFANLSNPPVVLEKPSEAEEDDRDESDVDDSQLNLPQIALPDVIEVKTGEEDEESVYVHRAKIYRYDKETKEWKERGVGDLKILKHKTENRYRMLMRREQVHKLACNHYIIPDMTFSPLPKSATSVSWVANDFSEGEVIQEFLAVKFKNAEILKDFLNKISEIQEDLKLNDSSAKNDDVSDSGVTDSSDSD